MTAYCILPDLISRFILLYLALHIQKLTMFLLLIY